VEKLDRAIMLWSISTPTPTTDGFQKISWGRPQLSVSRRETLRYVQAGAAHLWAVQGRVGD